jgi:hypothetical protein
MNLQKNISSFLIDIIYTGDGPEVQQQIQSYLKK